MGTFVGGASGVAQVMRSVVFDDRGELWDARSRGLAGGLAASIGGDDLVEYTIRNLGFVAAKEMGGSLRISLRPSVVSPIAFGALLYWLHDRVVDRVLVSFLDKDWSHEMLRSRQDAVQKLMARVDLGQSTREGDFLHEELPLESLPSASPLRSVLDMWSATGGKLDRERLTPLLARALNGRFVMVEASPDRPSLVIKDVGGGLTKPAEYWLARSIGNRVEDQPDYEYGKWVAGFYRRVVATGVPSLSDVDAVINWPQHSRRSFRYRRLVVPFKDAGRSTMLLCASLTNPGINLRVKAGKEVGSAVQ